jgi:hypothetical protein
MKVETTVTLGNGKDKPKGETGAMYGQVMKHTKGFLWHTCKFLKNENKLMKATSMIMDRMNLRELEGKTGQDLVEAQEMWMAKHKNHVRVELNCQRNYVQQELRVFMMNEVFAKGKEDEWPDPKQIRALALRDGLQEICEEDANGEETPKQIEDREMNEKLFDKYWDVLIPKVAGFQNWQPARRHYGLLSYSEPLHSDREGHDQEPYVSAADEAFIVVLWENCCKKWKYWAEQKKNKKPLDKEHPDMVTPYTHAKGGRAKFGGWLDNGKGKYKTLVHQIRNNRVNEKPYVEQVEREALKRIRKLHNKDELDAKRKRPKMVKAVAALEEESSGDDDDDDWL